MVIQVYDFILLPMISEKRISQSLGLCLTILKEFFIFKIQ